jgi:hypothetical protein
MPTYTVHKQQIKADLIVTPNGYGFGGDWQLSIERGHIKKVFFLGQDAKVCHRILGLNPREVAQEIGSNDLTKSSTRKALAGLILQAFNVNEENENELFNLQPWELAAE